MTVETKDKLITAEGAKALYNKIGTHIDDSGNPYQGSTQLITDELGKTLVSEYVKQNALLSIIADATEEKAYVNDWNEVSEAIKEGLGETMFPIGTQLIVPWNFIQSTTTEYPSVFDVVHHGNVTLEDGEVVPGMFLQWHYCHPGTIVFDAAEPDSSFSSIQSYGSNRWYTSNVRQYLNSTNSALRFGWTKQTDTDVLASQYNSYGGFAAGFSDDFLSVLGKPKFVTQRNNISGDGNGGSDTAYDMFFLPSAEQHYFNTYLGTTSGVEGEYWEYWKRVAGTTSPLAGWQTHPQMITYQLGTSGGTTTARHVWLRSATRDNSYYVGSVSSSGGVNYGNAYYGLSVSPACVVI